MTQALYHPGRPTGRKRRVTLNHTPASNTQISRNIAVARKRKMMTQEDMAAALGVPVKTYAGWEARVEITAEHLGAIASALGCSAGSLYGETPVGEGPVLDLARRCQRLAPGDRRAVAALVDALLAERLAAAQEEKEEAQEEEKEGRSQDSEAPVA